MTDRGEDAIFYKHAFFYKIREIEFASKGERLIKRLGNHDLLPYCDNEKSTNGRWGPVRWFRGSLNVRFFFLFLLSPHVLS